ncbi:MAG: hypothetical protein KGL39_39785 [Patescibacteria group bacterium]|nr:hypothetical protein [Patescibacteria group bacterium]
MSHATVVQALQAHLDRVLTEGNRVKVLSLKEVAPEYKSTRPGDPQLPESPTYLLQIESLSTAKPTSECT